MLPLRQRIVAGLQLQYNTMQEGAFRLLLAKREEIDAGAAYVVTLRDYWVARSELATLLAGAAPLAGGATPASTTLTGSSLSSGPTH